MKPITLLPLLTVLPLLLAGCLLATGEDTPAALPTPTPPAALTQPPAATPAPTTPPQTGPAALLELPTASGALSLLRYPSGGQTCIAATFNPRVLESERCGAPNGAGVGYVATLLDAAGNSVPVVFGLVGDAAITAVAVEFAGGGSANATVQNGGYLLLLQPGQTPVMAYGVNQYGNLVGSWGLTP